MKPGKAIHPSNGIGSAPDQAVTPAGVVISFDQGAGYTRQSTVKVIVSNLEAIAGNTLEISFNNGRRWFAIPPAQTISLDVVCYHCSLRGGTGATAAYSILGIAA